MTSSEADTLRMRARMNVIYHQCLERWYRRLDFWFRVAAMVFAAAAASSLIEGEGPAEKAGAIAALLATVAGAVPTVAGWPERRQVHGSLAAGYLGHLHEVERAIRHNRLADVDDIARRCEETERTEAKDEGLAEKRMLAQAYRQVCLENGREPPAEAA